MKRLSAVLLAAVLMTPAMAYDIDDVYVFAWVGEANGANRAVCVFDFGAKQIAFGYKWNDDTDVSGLRPTSTDQAAWNYENGYFDTYWQTEMAPNGPLQPNTSEALLLTLKAANIPGLTIEYTYWSSFGMSPAVFSFDGYGRIHSDTVPTGESSGVGYYPTFWVLGYIDDWNEIYTPNDSLATWDPSGFGASQRILEDGFMDGWSQDTWVYGDAVKPFEPSEPTIPTIPEPATMSLLAVAALGLLKRRRAR